MMVLQCVSPCGLVIPTPRSPEDGDSKLHFPDAVVSTYKSTRRYNPEDQYRHLHTKFQRHFLFFFSQFIRNTHGRGDTLALSLAITDESRLTIKDLYLNTLYDNAALPRREID
jgi:hypothetical protein